MDPFFSQQQLFGSLTEAERSELAGICLRRELSNGEILFKENDLGDTMYFLASGILRVSKRVGEGESNTLALYRSPAVFGEMALVDVIPRYAQAEAIAPAVVFELKKSEFIKLRERQPAIALKVLDVVLSSLAVRMRALTDRLYGLY